MDCEKKRAGISLVVLLGVFFLSAILTVHSAEWVPLCLFKHISHLDCPGCGLVRSFISLSHGHWLDAIRFNALGPLIYLFFLAYLFQVFFRLLGKRPFAFTMPSGSLCFYLFAVLFWGQWFFKLSRGLGWV